jgi:hypothetical protein
MIMVKFSSKVSRAVDNPILGNSNKIVSIDIVSSDEALLNYLCARPLDQAKIDAMLLVLVSPPF